jgi:hypothetical protein
LRRAEVLSFRFAFSHVGFWTGIHAKTDTKHARMCLLCARRDDARRQGFRLSYEGGSSAMRKCWRGKVWICVQESSSGSVWIATIVGSTVQALFDLLFFSFLFFFFSPVAIPHHAASQPCETWRHFFFFAGLESRGRDKKQSTVDNPMDSVSVKFGDWTRLQIARDSGICMLSVKGVGGRRFPARLSSLSACFSSFCRVMNYKLWITSCLLFCRTIEFSAPMEIPAFYASRVKRGCGVSGLGSRDPEPETQRKSRVEMKWWKWWKWCRALRGRGPGLT